MITSNVGYFGHTFTLESCQRYFMAPPVLKGECSPSISASTSSGDTLCGARPCRRCEGLSDWLFWE